MGLRGKRRKSRREEQGTLRETEKNSKLNKDSSEPIMAIDREGDVPGRSLNLIPTVTTRGLRRATAGTEHADRASPPSETDEQLVGRLLREEDDRERGKPNSE